MELQAELLKRLDALADKLGTTGAYLWSVLLHQARIVGIEDAIYAAVFFGMAYGAHRLARRVCKIDNDEGWPMVVTVLLYVAAFILLIGAMAETYDAIWELLNPAYWALQEILGKVK